MLRTRTSARNLLRSHHMAQATHGCLHVIYKDCKPHGAVDIAGGGSPDLLFCGTALEQSFGAGSVHQPRPLHRQDHPANLQEILVPSSAVHVATGASCACMYHELTLHRSISVGWDAGATSLQRAQSAWALCQVPKPHAAVQTAS